MFNSAESRLLFKFYLNDGGMTQGFCEAFMMFLRQHKVSNTTKFFALSYFDRVEIG